MENTVGTKVKKSRADLEISCQKLRLLATQISLANERERIAISRKIHDEIGQNLVLCNINIAKIICSSHSDDLTQSLKEIQKIIKEALNEARSLVFEISPPSLNNIGLETTLQELTSRVGQEHHFDTSFEDDGQIKTLSEDVRILLFQMVRELLLNVAKHALAHKVRVTILKRNKTILITVTDDGTGFDTKLLHKRIKGLGLFKIREQLSQIGGFLEIESQEGKGTSITLIAPLVI